MMSLGVHPASEPNPRTCEITALTGFSNREDLQREQVITGSSALQAEVFTLYFKQVLVPWVMALQPLTAARKNYSCRRLVVLCWCFWLE